MVGTMAAAEHGRIQRVSESAEIEPWAEPCTHCHKSDGQLQYCWYLAQLVHGIVQIQTDRMSDGSKGQGTLEKEEAKPAFELERDQQANPAERTCVTWQ